MATHVKINDTFGVHDKRHHELIAALSGPEDEYVPPKVWPYQVPPEKQIRSPR